MVTIVSLSEDNHENPPQQASNITEIKQESCGKDGSTNILLNARQSDINFFTSGQSENVSPHTNEVRWVFPNTNGNSPQTNLNLVEETANYKFFEEIDEENDYKFYKAICAKKSGTFVQVGGKVSLQDGGVGIVAGLARSPYRAIEAFIYNTSTEKLSVVAFGRVLSLDKDSLSASVLSSNSVELQKATMALTEWKKRNGTRKHKRKEDKREDPLSLLNSNGHSYFPPSSSPQKANVLDGKEPQTTPPPHEGLKRSFKEIILHEINKNENQEDDMERATKYKKLETVTTQLLNIQQAELSKLELELQEKHKLEREQLALRQQQESQQIFFQRQQLQQQHKQQLSILQQMFSK
jgi:hypothetical protein